MTKLRPLEYQTPPPPPMPMSVTCCVAFTWALPTSPLVTMFLGAFLFGGDRLEWLFWRYPPVKVALLIGLPLVGLFLAVKGVTDIDRRRDRDGRRLGMFAVWVAALSLFAGALFFKG